MKFGAYLQPTWDWRAAGNFILGGAGGALLAATAAVSYPAAPALPAVLLAVMLVAAGLGLVWLEIGRPWRALHVFFHPQTSWMTREGSVATVMLPLAIAGLIAQSAALIGAAGLLGLAFLYCQGRILEASKGIPAWRERSVVPLTVTTGLTEGSGLALLLSAAAGQAPRWLEALLVALLALRVVLWLYYRQRLNDEGVPAPTRTALDGIHGLFVWVGNVLPAVFALAALAGAGSWLTVLAAGFAVAGGWHMKFVLITRAAYVQGYGVGRLQRGRPTPKPPVRRQGDPFRL
ncbi:MAG: phenylacetyl-CoA:acceptor oxidoreductase [Gammaproteobacteria bacterium]|nr:phenylacetyl-CoA:acceptor oxidoreductase [Gammaproteobacteria bacterium]